MGEIYREYLVNFIGREARGSADLVAYFLLRAEDMLKFDGQAGLIATNTLAQGDTREVGLDRIIDEGVVIRSGIKSERWPSKSAVLEYCAIWTSKIMISDVAQRHLNRVQVDQGISSSLDLLSRASGQPTRLVENSLGAFIGTYVLGTGFTMDPKKALQLIHADSRNSEVLFPYVNGQDLNQRPDSSASRWVINFHDWDEDEARTYPECFEQVVALVKPERQRLKADGSPAIPGPAHTYYWRYERRRPELYKSISEFHRVIVIARVAKAVMPVMISAGQIYSEQIVVFPSDDHALLAYLSSAPHYWWAIQRGSTMKGDLRYTPTDVFETLPRPEFSEKLRELGSRLDSERRELMLARQAGLTDTYNMVHDPANSDADISNLREIHRLIDIEVCRCYGWDDLIPDLAHDHYDTRQGTRYTIAPAPRQEILDRLLEENQRRYALEVAQGLHSKKSATKAAKKKRSAPEQQGLF